MSRIVKALTIQKTDVMVRESDEAYEANHESSQSRVSIN